MVFDIWARVHQQMAATEAALLELASLQPTHQSDFVDARHGHQSVEQQLHVVQNAMLGRSQSPGIQPKQRFPLLIQASIM